METIYRVRAAWAVVWFIAGVLMLILEAWAWFFPIVALGFEGVLILNFWAGRAIFKRDSEIHDFSEFRNHQELLLPAIGRILQDEAGQGTKSLALKIVGDLQHPNGGGLQAPLSAKTCAAWHLEVTVRRKSWFGGLANRLLLVDQSRFDEAFLTSDDQKLRLEEPGLVSGGVRTKTVMSMKTAPEKTAIWEMVQNGLTAHNIAVKTIRALEVVEERIDIGDTVTVYGSVLLKAQGLVLRGSDQRGDPGSLFMYSEPVAGNNDSTSKERFGQLRLQVAIGVVGLLALGAIWFGPIRLAFPAADLFGWFVEGPVWFFPRSANWVFRVEKSPQDPVDRWVFEASQGSAKKHLTDNDVDVQLSTDRTVTLSSFTTSIVKIDPESTLAPVWKSNHWEFTIPRLEAPPAQGPVAGHSGRLYVTNQTDREFALKLFRGNLSDRIRGNWNYKKKEGTNYQYGSYLTMDNADVKVQDGDLVQVTAGRDQRLFRLGFSPAARWVPADALWQLSLDAEALVSHTGTVTVQNAQAQSLWIRLVAPDGTKSDRYYLPAGPGPFGNEVQTEAIGETKGKAAFTDLTGLEIEVIWETLVYRGTLGRMPNAKWTGKFWELKP